MGQSNELFYLALKFRGGDEPNFPDSQNLQILVI